MFLLFWCYVSGDWASVYMIGVTHHVLLLHMMRMAHIIIAASVIPVSVNPVTSEDQSSPRISETPEAKTASDECYSLTAHECFSLTHSWVSVESDRRVSPGVGSVWGIWPTSDVQLYSSLQSLQMASDSDLSLPLTLITYCWCKNNLSSGSTTWVSSVPLESTSYTDMDRMGSESAHHLKIFCL